MTEVLEQSPAEVLLRRRSLRANFGDWCELVLSDKNETPALHHKLLIHTLQKVADGTGPKKIMILMPPGSAKSTYTSVCFPPWYLNRHPQHLILACSYAYTLIEGFGKDCRNLVERYSNELGYELSKASAAAGDWRTNRGGGYWCAGVGAGIAGHRADVAFIDDYVGTEENVDSKDLRDKIDNWYKRDFVPRLKPNATRIIIANRRHEDDLVGRLLAREGDEWCVITLPMLAEEDDILGRAVGERLWPEWFTEEMVIEAKKDPTTWAGLYQQRPSPEEGNYFKKDWIIKYKIKDLPSDLRPYVGSDFAVRKQSKNDKFCFLPAGIDSQDNLWILPNWYWTRADSGEAVEEMLKLAQRHSPICWWAGRENITGSIAPFLYKRMQETGIYIPIEELSEGKDKQAKAQSIRARMSAKKVFFPDIPAFADAEHEILTFPGGLHDDFVDALSKLGQGLLKMVGNSTKQPEKSIEEILNPRITCGWVQDSARRKERRRHLCEV